MAEEVLPCGCGSPIPSVLNEPTPIFSLLITPTDNPTSQTQQIDYLDIWLSSEEHQSFSSDSYLEKSKRNRCKRLKKIFTKNDELSLDDRQLMVGDLLNHYIGEGSISYFDLNSCFKVSYHLITNGLSEKPQTPIADEL